MRTAPLLAALSSLALLAPAWAQPIVTDGEFTDWDLVAPVFTDPAGDSTGVFDLGAVWITSDAERIHVSFEVGTDAHNLQAGGYPSSQGLTFELLFAGSPVESLRVETLPHLLRVTENGATTLRSAQDTGLLLLPTYASQRYEFSVPRSLAPGATSVQFATTGADTLTTAPVALSDASPAAATATADRHPDAHLRVASLNTLNNFNTDTTGIEDPVRRPRFTRLVRAVRADVYCIQEEYSTSAADIETFFEDADPFDDGAEWHAVKVGDTVIASRYPLVLPAIFDRTRFGDAVAFVDMAAAGRGLVLVSSIHPACCGYAGNSNDDERVEQHENIAEAIASIAGGSSESAAPGSSEAPAIVAGDWNLVGSRAPLTVIEDVGLFAPTPTDLGTGASAVTWRDPSDAIGQFFPGRLDYIAHDTVGLRPRNRFVLDSQTLGPAQLAALGLQSDDSAASDHLMVVADLAFPASGPDLTGDGVVDSSDLASLLSMWGQDGPADFTGDGVVDSADLAVILAAWD